MKKIYINRKPYYGPYGGGTLFVNAVYQYAEQFGYEIWDPKNYRFEENNNARIFAPLNADIIFMMDPRLGDERIGLDQLKETLKRNDLSVKPYIIHRVNEIDKKRSIPIGIDNQLRELSSISDLTIFVSNWMKEEHESMGWFCENKKVLFNGVDQNIFKDYNNKKSKEDGKVNVCVHHWSPDPGKGDELHKFLHQFCNIENPDKFSFTYIGRTNLNLGKHKIEPLSGIDLAKELSKYDVYINGSKHDPLPNSILEILSVGLPTYVPFNGGGSIELAGKDHIWNDFEYIKDLLINKKFIKNNSFKLSSWEDCMKQFFGMLDELLLSR